MKLLVIDTETSGLNPSRHGILQLGALVFVNNDSLKSYSKPVAKFNQRLNLSYRDIDPAAMLVNRLSASDLNMDKYIDDREVAYNFVDFVNKEGPFDALVGFNLQFDLAFIRTLFDSSNIDFENLFPRRQLDPSIIGSFLQYSGWLPFDYSDGTNIVKIRSLESFCNFFKIKVKNNHNAIVDADLTYKVLIELSKFLVDSSKCLS